MLFPRVCMCKKHQSSQAKLGLRPRPPSRSKTIHKNLSTLSVASHTLLWRFQFLWEKFDGFSHQRNESIPLGGSRWHILEQVSVLDVFMTTSCHIKVYTSYHHCSTSQAGCGGREEEEQICKVCSFWMEGVILVKISPICLRLKLSSLGLEIAPLLLGQLSERCW